MTRMAHARSQEHGNVPEGRRRNGSSYLQEEPWVHEPAIYPNRPMQVAARRVSCRVLGANELPGRDLCSDVDASGRPGGHMGVPGPHTGGVADDHEPCLG